MARRRTGSIGFRLAALAALAALLAVPVLTGGGAAAEVMPSASAELTPTPTPIILWPGNVMPADERFDPNEPDESNDLNITLSVKPAELVTPGEVAITFVITNQSDYDVQNVTISTEDLLSAPLDAQFSEPIGRIRVGESQTVVRAHTVTQEELDAGSIDYYITYDSMRPGSVTLGYTKPVAIAKVQPRPQVDFTRQLSSRYVTSGGTLTITYRLRNVGNVPVTGLRLSDALGSFAARLEHLDVGESRTFISRVTVTGDTASRPVLEYAAESGPSGEIALDPLDIRLATGELKAGFSVSRSLFNEDTADATLTLTNTGNAPCTNVTVVDDLYGGVIADGLTVPPGGTGTKVSFTYPLRDGHSQYRWSVSGVSGAGEPLSLTTETVTLAQPQQPQSIDMRLSAVARTPRISRAGTVRFDVTLTNDGTAMAEDAQLYEVNRGEIRRLAVLPPGAPTSCTVSYPVRGDSQFIFCLNYTDADGRKRTVSAAPVDVRVAPDGVDPEVPEATVAPRGESMKLGSTRTFTVLLIVAAGALLVMVVILVGASLHARRDRRRRLAAERRRLKEEMGKTNPFTPLKAEMLRRKMR